MISYPLDNGYKIPVIFPYFRHAVMFIYAVFINSVYILVDIYSFLHLLGVWILSEFHGRDKMNKHLFIRGQDPQ